MIEIERLEPEDFAAAVPALAELLVDAVASGASVGFVRPFSAADAERWWRDLAPAVSAGTTLVLVARDDGRIVGTAQLRLAHLPNQRHRADVAKVLVHRSARRRGIATALMAEIDWAARAEGRTLLVLDTVTGSDAERLYTNLGWTRVGEIPEYAAMPDGRLSPTTVFYRIVPP